MKFFIKTYGCQMNERDSEAVAALLLSCGHEQARNENEAEVVIVNTCSVRDKAETKAVGKLGILASEKRPGQLIGVMGCMAQRLGAGLVAKLPGIDFVIGTRRLGALPRAIESAAEGARPFIDLGEHGADDSIPDAHLYGDRPAGAFVNALFGCDRRCSYCIVPAVRGHERSRPAEEILREVRELADHGVREITLLGQSILSYGRKGNAMPAGHVSPRGFTEPFPQLLEAVAGVPGIRRIRFTSAHPSGCTKELAAAFATIEQVCEHIHLPLQSGSDRILKLMRRGYTADEYRKAVDRLREATPEIAFTTDIIVGFPTETEEDFEATRAFVREIGFDNAFVFKYSPRPGTAAAEWKDDVPPAEKLRRNRILLEDLDEIAMKRHGRRIGRICEVMAEGPSLRNRRKWAGRTRDFMNVVFDPPAGIRSGDFLNVVIRRATPQTLYGEVTP